MSMHDSLFYFATPQSIGSDQALAVSRMAFEEPMAKGVVRRPGTGDLFFLLLPKGGEIKDQHGIQRVSQPAFVYWRERQAHHYGNLNKKWPHTWLHVSGRSLKRLSHLCPSNTCVPLPDATKVKMQFRGIYNELQEQQPIEQIILNAIETMLLHCRRYMPDREQPLIPETFIKIKQFIDNNAQMPLSLTELAERVALSNSHFSSRFREYFSCSPIDYVISVRMEQAQYLFGNRDLSIAEVAESVGYEDVAYFSRLVKRYFGINPRELRKQLLEH